MHEYCKCDSPLPSGMGDQIYDEFLELCDRCLLPIAPEPEETPP